MAKTKNKKKLKRKYVFKEKSPMSHYKADAFVVRCVDNRFWAVAKHFIEELGLKFIDPKFPAGGAKVFSSPFGKSERRHYIRQLEISIRLHHVKRVMLFTHHDCGAYGGFANFNENAEKELVFHIAEHKKAIKTIRKHFPGLKVETYFLDEVGVIKTGK